MRDRSENSKKMNCCIFILGAGIAAGINAGVLALGSKVLLESGHNNYRALTGNTSSEIGAIAGAMTFPVSRIFRACCTHEGSGGNMSIAESLVATAISFGFDAIAALILNQEDLIPETLASAATGGGILSGGILAIACLGGCVYFCAKAATTDIDFNIYRSRAVPTEDVEDPATDGNPTP